MPVEIVPFRDTHLEEAAALLALRHQGEYTLEPALPERFTQAAVARTAVEATWSEPNASGVVALDARRMIGYLIGVPRIDLVWGRSVWVPLPGHAVERAYGSEVYRDLYATLSPSWVAFGCFAHYALVPASDRDALEAWFALSFGKEQAYGIRETAEAAALAAPVDPSLSIRRAALADLEASIELDEIIPRHQSRSPVYAPFWGGEYTPFWLGNKEDLRQESIAILENEQAMLWLALRAELAKAGAEDALTEALASWTATLWKPRRRLADGPVPVFYVDGHRKAVYTDHLIPRGLVGRLGKILGSRALVVLHDQAGHPLLATTHRGDQHLTSGLPAIIAHYEQAAGLLCLQRVVVDREGMAAEFLAAVASQGRTVVTVLRTDQYSGLESFREVGEFVPLRVDRQGKVTREVALARFSVPLPEHPGQELDMRVALIRDLGRQVPNEQRAEDEDGPRRWDEKPDGAHENWLGANWQARPTPALPTVPKLIPIVTTAPEADAVELAQTYTGRWPAQENAS